MIIADNNLIMWQSASIKGDHHKTKELIGRIGMLVVEDNGSKISSAKYKQTILVIDGTWTQDQIQRMNDAGFDRIYYVDEIDLLKTELNL